MRKLIQRIKCKFDRHGDIEAGVDYSKDEIFFRCDCCKKVLYKHAAFNRIDYAVIRTLPKELQRLLQ